ncbi:sensor domain-containing diguanylate cyclase [Herbaspirillum lusitanum]|uniref:diguanylate cyclase n=1 Tax=Herbaspirillum lusitanum TaxID=213312 RepID=A0ABW9A7C0_9BURK
MNDMQTEYHPGLFLTTDTANTRIQMAHRSGDSDAWLPTMLADFVSLASSLCEVPIGMVSQLHEDIGLQHPFLSFLTNGEIDRRNQWWRFPGQTGVIRSSCDFTLCEFAAQRPREVTEISDLRADSRFSETVLTTTPPQIRFYASVPLVASNGDVMGTLCVMDSKPNSLTPTQREALRVLARQLEAQLESRRTVQKLEEQTLTDALTGIGNRRNFDLRLREEWTRHLRNAKPLSMLMVDVDYFKQYNDTYGHPAGDALLTQLARVLRSPLRASDFVARYGGDEFALILPDTEENGAHLVRERIHAAVEIAKWPHSEIEISVGAATLTPSEMCDFHALLQAADTAMYSRKKNRSTTAHN